MCAIFGIYGLKLDVSGLTFFPMLGMQHRGQESSGITVGNGKKLATYRGAGLVSAVYNEDNLKRLKGHIAIGHNRYSTSGDSKLSHSQPIVIGERMKFQNKMREGSTGGAVAVAHNGNLPSVVALEQFLTSKNIATAGCSDSELMARAIEFHMQKKTLPNAIKACLPLFTGAYCLVVATPTMLVAIRDQCGIRPLSLGKLNGGHVIASETCAFDTIGAEFVRDIKPGEMVIINERGLHSEQVMVSNLKLDSFELVYFARHDSVIEGHSVYDMRYNSGIQLAHEYPLDVDIVVPVPETSLPVALGYADTLKIRYVPALAKNRYIYRTFIQPEQHLRDLGVRLKLNPLAHLIRGKRAALVDDSIVRGTTSRQIVEMMFKAGAIEVHFISASPPVRFPDFYGIDTSKQEKLIAAQKTVEEIRKFLGATSLHFLTLPGLIRATGMPFESLSTSCFTGDYPISLHERESEFTRNVPTT